MAAIVTDLNQRERARYAGALEKMADSARALAQALRDGDDTAAVVQLVGVSLSGAMLNELTDVFQAAVSADIPDHPPTVDERQAG